MVFRAGEQGANHGHFVWLGPVGGCGGVPLADNVFFFAGYTAYRQSFVVFQVVGYLGL